MGRSTTRGRGWGAAALVVLLTASLFVPLGAGGAAGRDGTISTFSTGEDGTLEVGPNATGNASFELPRNSTVLSAEFLVSVTAGEASPGALRLDLDSDGSAEFAWDRTGYGDLGEQTTFNDGAATNDTLLAAGPQLGPGFLLPESAAIANASFEASFSPVVAGDLVATGGLLDLATGDLDGDGWQEIVVLDADMNGTLAPTPGLGIIDLNTTTGQAAPTVWQAACEGQSLLFVGDLDGDAVAEILTLNGTGTAWCLSSWDAPNATLVLEDSGNLSAGVSGATLADLDGDGDLELVTIHVGQVAMLDHEGGSPSSDNLTITREGFPDPATLLYVAAGPIWGPGNDTVVVADNEGRIMLYNRTTNFEWTNRTLANGSCGADLHLMDVDADGMLDILANTGGAGCMALFNGSGWAVSGFTGPDLTNASVGDIDGDGVEELVIPELAASTDGNGMTLDGGLNVHPVSPAGIELVATQTLQPNSLPQSVLLVDLDGDGSLEHVAPGGEGMPDLAIVAWVNLTMDLGGGPLELDLTGYAGDGHDAWSPLMWSDSGGMAPALSGGLQDHTSVLDDHGFNLRDVRPTLTSNVAGVFSSFNLSIDYGVDLLVNQNPGTGSLADTLNRMMQLGTGNMTIDLPFEATRNGTILIAGLTVQYVDGAPDLSIPDPPVLLATEVTWEHVVLSLNSNAHLNGTFLRYELFRVLEGQSFDLGTPLVNLADPQFEDLAVSPETNYSYVTRAVYDFGVVTNLSNVYTARVPAAPDLVAPDPVDGVMVIDTPADLGGSLDVSWNASAASDISHYLVYVATSNVSNVSTLRSVDNVTHSAGTVTTTVTRTSDVLDSVGSVVTSGGPLPTSTDLWVAIAPVDTSGNLPMLSGMVGPVQTLPNVDLPSNLSIEVFGLGGGAIPILELGSPVQARATLTDEGGSPLQGRTVTITVGQGTASAAFNGTTDAQGQWILSLSDWSEVANVTGPLAGAVWFNASFGGSLSYAVSTASDEATVRSGAALSGPSPPVTATAGTTTVAFSLAAADALEQPLYAGLEVAWSFTPASGTGANGTALVGATGAISISLDASAGGELSVTLTPPAWAAVAPATVNLTISAAPGSAASFPAPAVSCSSATAVVPHQQTVDVTCTVTNPHTAEVTLTVGVSGAGPATTITASPATLAAAASGTITIQLDATALTDAGSGTKLLEVTASVSGIGTNASTATIAWEHVGPADDGQIDTQGGGDGPSTGLILALVVVALIVAAIGFVVLRIIMSDPDEVEFDSLEGEGTSFTEVARSSRKREGGSLSAAKKRVSGDEDDDAEDGDDEEDDDDADDAKQAEEKAPASRVTEIDPAEARSRPVRSVTDLTPVGGSATARVVGGVVDLTAEAESSDEDDKEEDEDDAAPPPAEEDEDVDESPPPAAAAAAAGAPRGPRRDRARVGASPGTADDSGDGDDEDRRRPVRAKGGAGPREGPHRGQAPRGPRRGGAAARAPRGDPRGRAKAREEPAEQEAASDDGVTVDEDGTEWYEDGEGTWWYRQAGDEDWAEFKD